MHTGIAVPQSAFDRHATQAWVDARQRGAPAGQSVFCRHCTHCSVVASQIAPPAAPPVQSDAILQPMQAPELVSHMGLRPPHWALLVHAAWQVLLPGQHTGVAPEHPAEPVHCWQRPCEQYGAVAGQSGSVRHMTQPSAESQNWFIGHALLPLGPQRALPPPGPPFSPPLVELPPHATTPAATVATKATTARTRPKRAG